MNIANSIFQELSSSNVLQSIVYYFHYMRSIMLHFAAKIYIQKKKYISECHIRRGSQLNK